MMGVTQPVCRFRHNPPDERPGKRVRLRASNNTMSQTQWMPEVRAMWAKLEGFQFDEEDAVFDFEARLARENGWSREFASRVIQEYRRFLLLAMCAGHPVTPSDEVDQAWHLHLVYTRSYWDDLCRDVLGRPLHHGPTKGGRAEGEKFADWYDKTRKSYARIFGSEPPSDIWPEGAVRFDVKPRFERVDRCRFWLVPKFNIRKPSLAALMACAAAGLAACSGGEGWDGDATFILGGLTIFGLVAFLAYRSCKHGGGRGGGCGSSGCSFGGGMSGCTSSGGDSGGSGHHSGCGSRASGCGSHGGSSGCGSSGCGSSGCGGGGCGGGGD